MGAPAALAAGHHHHDTRPSHDTAYTGSTVTAPNHATYAGNKYDPTGPNVANEPIAPTTGGTDVRVGHGYHTHPTGTAVNPYGYDNSRTAATNY
jgi:hypothetical protein